MLCLRQYSEGAHAVSQKDAEELRLQLQAVRGEMAAAAQKGEAERSEHQAKLQRMQSEADATARSHSSCP